MTWKVTYGSGAGRDMRRLDKASGARIADALDRLATTGAGDIRRIRGSDDDWRLRVGHWRIIYEYRDHEREIYVKRVRRRDAVYRQ